AGIAQQGVQGEVLLLVDGFENHVGRGGLFVVLEQDDEFPGFGRGFNDCLGGCYGGGVKKTPKTKSMDSSRMRMAFSLSLSFTTGQSASQFCDHGADNLAQLQNRRKNRHLRRLSPAGPGSGNRPSSKSDDLNQAKPAQQR
ncbi:hypothetical protein, partial [Thiolapillus sp.]